MSGPVDGDTLVLENALSRYAEEGYEVFVHPSSSVLPAFMRDYQPDAVALRRDKNIAIEVVRPWPGRSDKVDQIQKLLAPHSDWELQVLYVSPRTAEPPLAIASQQEIENALHRVSELKTNGHRLPALVMAWAAFEAIGRALLPDRLGRPQTPLRLVEALAFEGYVTPREADLLRAAIPVRNAAVHGRLDVDIDDSRLAQIITAVQHLADYLREQASPPA
jgi:uncharacterized protein YutE (UPF0331/DUF86 family)